MNSLEPIDVAIGLLSTIISPELAQIVAPYTIIILAATLGAGWSLGGKSDLGKGKALWFFLKINGTAILITVAIASNISSKLGVSEAKWLLAPVALIIGIIGDEWSNLGRWVVGKIKSFIEKEN